VIALKYSDVVTPLRPVNRLFNYLTPVIRDTLDQTRLCFHDQVSCRLEAGPSSSSFQLIRLVAGQYKLTTSRKLDFETESSLPVSVTCFDNGQPVLSTTTNITVNVVDVNDNSPQFLQTLYNVSVDESTMADVTLVQV